MSEPEKPQLPAAPSYYHDPNFESNANRLTSLGKGLTSGDFMSPSGDLGFLNQLVTLNPQATQAAIGLATRGVSDLRGKAQQDILNQLEANNQLTSSVAVNRLSDLNEAYSQDLADIHTRFYIEDVNRSLSNIGTLFGLGLDTTQAAGQMGLSQQNSKNQFNLANYENQVAQAQSQQSSGRGGMYGGIAGTVIGSMFGQPAIGGAIGSGLGEAISPSATGNVAASFGTGALSMLGQEAINQRRITAGTGTSRYFNTGIAEDPNRISGYLQPQYGSLGY